VNGYSLFSKEYIEKGTYIRLGKHNVKKFKLQTVCSTILPLFYFITELCVKKFKKMIDERLNTIGLGLQFTLL